MQPRSEAGPPWIVGLIPGKGLDAGISGGSVSASAPMGSPVVTRTWLEVTSRRWRLVIAGESRNNVIDWRCHWQRCFGTTR